MEDKELELKKTEEQDSSSVENKKGRPKKTEVKTLSEESKPITKLEEPIVERKFEITGNILGFNNEYYTLLNPEIKANSNDLERIAFLEKLIKFKMIKEIK